MIQKLEVREVAKIAARKRRITRHFAVGFQSFIYSEGGPGMWQNADFLDSFCRPIRIVSLDVSCRHADGQEVARVNLISDGAPSVVAQLASLETEVLVRQFVETLPRRDRDIVRRVFWDGETQTAVAADLGVSKMAVSKAISRITKRGRDVLPRCEHMMVG